MNKRMFQRLQRRAPFLWINRQAPLQQIHKEHQLLRILIPPPRSHQPTLQLSRRLLKVQRPDHIVSRDLIHLHTPEPAGIIKVQGGELRLAKELVGELPTTLHDAAQHLVVRAASEQDFAGVELVEGAAGRPHVDGEVVRDAEYDFGGAVEAGDEVGSDFVFAGVGGGAEIADFKEVLVLRDLHELDTVKARVSGGCLQERCQV